MGWRDVIDGRTVLAIPQGTSWTREWFVEAPNQTPIDLTEPGYSAKAEVRARRSESAVLYTWSSDTANCDLTAAGKIILTLEPSETSEWPFRTAVWDLELTHPDGSVDRIDSGVLTVSPEVTRAP